MIRVRTLLEFVKFEHTLFSLPLLLAGAMLGAGGWPDAKPLLWILVAGTGARTLAMALNRIIDRRIDARNPRTAARELPAGRMSLGVAWAVAAAGTALFYLGVANLPPICLRLSPVPLALFALYPFLKRWTPLAHFGVGAALAFGPLAAYAAVTGRVLPLGAVHLLVGFTWLWVAGFDVIYATLDEDFDRKAGLRSLPTALGSRRALAVAAGVHSVAFALLLAMAVRHLKGPFVVPLAGAVGALLLAEHLLARKVDLAFFRINAWLGFVVLALVGFGVG
ncbi:MAG: 4-hydroxybenzoate octaprenyltransferase [Candidatus Eiseniibacteriota bacterium]